MRAWIHAVVAVAVASVFVLALEVPTLDDRGVLVVSDLGQLAAAAAAAVLCLRASRTAGGRVSSWRWLGLGVGAWAAGQLVWTWSEVVVGSEVPFPSPADLGFALFPLLSGVGLLAWLGAQGRHDAVARGRDVLDGTIIGISLLVLSWVTSLGNVVTEAGNEWLSFALSVLYPIGDVVLATLVLLAVARGRAPERPVLLLLASGLGALTLADSAYLYLVNVGDYTSADVVSSGWVLGFLLVGAAARLEQGRDRRPHAVADPDDGAAPSLLAAALPYVPFATAGLAVSYSLLTASEDPPVVDLSLGVVLVVLVLGRQFLAMAENQRLYVDLGTARDQLERQALHDPLTGLPNRALFTDRLENALLRTGHDVGLLFCDLDDFKQVNDRHGHDVGDLLLREVADRFVASVREQDTVARLGGDEFAVLLDDPEDAVAAAERLVAVMAEPFDLRGGPVRVSVSVGVAHHRTAAVPSGRDRRTCDRQQALADPPGAARGGHGLTGADLLLRLADQAMYAAKTSGKGRVVRAEDDATVPDGRSASG